MFPLIQERREAGISAPANLPCGVGSRPCVEFRVTGGSGLQLKGGAVVNDQYPSVSGHKIPRAARTLVGPSSDRPGVGGGLADQERGGAGHTHVRVVSSIIGEQ